jgi:RHS repeat-associated protein
LTATGKVQRVERADGTTIDFAYDGAGRRVMTRKAAAGATATTWYVLDANGRMLSLYRDGGDGLIWEGSPIYGGGRLGTYLAARTMAATPDEPDRPIAFERGKKRYELTDKVGNVLAVVTCRKVTANGEEAERGVLYESDVAGAWDYYPFGMLMPGRTTEASNYRFGFQGMEQDRELKGEGKSYTTEFRSYDPRVGRWVSIDPLVDRFPQESSFSAFGNNPWGPAIRSA